jgi:hypothetical protein
VANCWLSPPILDDIVTCISLFFTFYILYSYPNFPIILCSPSDDKGWASENKAIELLFPQVFIAKTDKKTVNFSDTRLKEDIQISTPI